VESFYAVAAYGDTLWSAMLMMDYFKSSSSCISLAANFHVLVSKEKTAYTAVAFTVSDVPWRYVRRSYIEKFGAFQSTPSQCATTLAVP
jgi:hypothetical protein